MFDGMAEQFYQFLAATTASRTTPTHITTSAATISCLPLSFTLHNHTNTTTTNTNNAHHHFSTYSSSSSQHHQPQQQPCFDAAYHHLLHQHHPHFLPRNDDKDEDDHETGLDDPSHDDGAQRSLTMFLPEIPWSSDEMLALFRIRSSVDNSWFPDFIWETVSRKLAELGFKRSAEKCKEKFEEETRSFNSSIISSCNNKNNNASHNNNNNYRLFHELEELCNNNNNNANNTVNGENNDHGSLQHNALLHPPLLPPDERDHVPQPSLSQKGPCLGGDDDEDSDNNVDDENDLGVDEEDNTGGERLGDEGGGEEHRGNGENNKNNVGDDDDQSVGDSEKTQENTKRVMRKRKRQKKFEMFKGFCEKIVNEMMAQQQQLHCKILQDMVKRDEEKIAKEETWKKQEIERLEKELEVRAHEQAIAGDRQAKIFDFLKKFSTSTSNVMDHSQSLKETLEKLNKVPNFTSSNSSILSQDSIRSAQLQPTSSCTTHDDNHHTPLVMSHQTCPNIPNSSSNDVNDLALLSSIRLENSKLTPPSMDQAPQNPNLVASHDDSPRPPSVVSSSHNFTRADHTSTNAMEHVTEHKTLEDNNHTTTPIVRSGKDDTGRRWPRDEVLALINIRCSLFNNNNGGGDAQNDKEGFSKGPLWERISQKMTELGYKRSAKRCKEKWENINKYFRKTKDMNKKRSIDSRTCPYFHQLSHLYSQGTLVGPTDRPTNHPNSPDTKSMAFSGTHQGGSTTPANDANNAMHTSQGNEGVVQVPGFDFEF